jgi:Resolvase, N terminal domain
MNTAINEQQLSKTAYVYVRQSTLAQVRHHQESTERQYALKEKALQLGWNDSTVQILDRDLGKSGAQITGRGDFKTLVAEVSMGQVGAVFALEVSRLARSNLDWHRLLELCALTDTLVIDEDGCYNPADFNDGLLLGLKRPGSYCTSCSTFSAVEGKERARCPLASTPICASLTHPADKYNLHAGY